MKRTVLSLCAAVCALVHTGAQTARFSAQEAMETYYEMGWDSQEESATWTYKATASGRFTWYMEANPPYAGQKAFSAIDAKSRYSLCARYNDNATQDEVATSPAIEIKARSVAEFYTCFRSVFLLGHPWKFVITDTEGDSIAYELNGFLWAQNNAYTGPSWQKFTIDLSAFEGMKATFAFQYAGGEDLAVDGFRLSQLSDGTDGTISIAEGQAVHFIDLSEGDVTSRQWKFQGGQPATSGDPSPTVVYPTAGDYDVELTITTADGSATAVRRGYVHVGVEAPQALIGLPAEGYLSPWVARFVPTGQPLHYRDLSSGNPTSWHWTFPGGTPAESSEQHPVVIYEEPGLYGMTLEVENSVCTSNDFMVRALQAGGSQYVWNIDIDEYDQLGELQLGFYGFYAGSNYLGIQTFAELYDQPAETVTIDTVQVYFYRTDIGTAAGRDITVQLCDVDEHGLPGHVLASATMAAASLASSTSDVVPTSFVLSPAVTTNQPFFVTIGPFDQPADDEAISIMSLRRDEGARSTTYHLLADEDMTTGQPLGTYSWYRNDDDPVSMCITPRLTYGSAPSALGSVGQPRDVAPAGRYNVAGQALSRNHRGIVIVRQADGTVRKTVVGH